MKKINGSSIVEIKKAWMPVKMYGIILKLYESYLIHCSKLENTL